MIYLKEAYMKIKTVIVLLVLTVLTTGCSINEEMDENNNANDNNVEFNQQSIQNQESEKNNKYVKLYGTLMRFEGKIDVNDFSWNNEKYTKDGEMADEGEVSWQGDKGSYIFTQPGYVYYTAKEYNNNYDSLLCGKNGNFREDFDEVTEGVTSIEGITENQAVDIVQNIINKYEINTGNVRAYPLNKDVLKRLSRDYMSDEEYSEYIKDKSNEPLKREFTKDDEVYLVVMRPMVEQYPLYNSEYDYGKTAYSGSLIWALVNNNKVIALYADGIYETKDQSTEISNIFTTEEAEEILEKKYKDMLLSNHVVCKNIRITYVAVNSGNDKSYEFIPAYVFDLQYPIKDDKSSEKGDVTYITQRLLLDAENGKWIE